MDHQQAIASHAVERYLLEEMSDADRDAFEAHYFSCTTCAEDVRVAAVMRDGVKAGLVAAGSQERSAAAVVPISSRRPWHTSVMLPWAAAAMLALVAGYQAVWPAAAPPAPATQALSPISLRPASRGAIVTVARPQEGMVVLALDVMAVDPGVALTYDLRTVDDKSVASGVAQAPPVGTPLLLLVSASTLNAPGSYLLLVRAGAGSEPPIAEYRFAVAKQ
jgi:hypothetical protein